MHILQHTPEYPNLLHEFTLLRKRNQREIELVALDVVGLMSRNDSSTMPLVETLALVNSEDQDLTWSRCRRITRPSASLIW